jgi:predicted amidohydrolase YtcJ
VLRIVVLAALLYLVALPAVLAKEAGVVESMDEITFGAETVLRGIDESGSSGHADLIIGGGNIITVNDQQPAACAIAVRDGKVIAVGSSADLMTRKGKGTMVVDLGGKTLVPVFIDPHSHFMNALAISSQVNCFAPPVGPVRSLSVIIRALKQHLRTRKIPKGELIIGYGYDAGILTEGRELTRDDLDPHFPDHPVMILHVSLHGAVLNSAAMKRFGVSSATKTPAGGVILRRPGSGEPAGLLMETAFLPVYEALPRPTEDQAMSQVKEAQAIYAAAGVTTAQEGATHAADLALLQRAAAKGALYLDVVAYPFITDLDRVLEKNPPGSFGSYHRHLKLGGVKIVADGSPQGKTAYFSTPYLTGGPEGEQTWRGQPSSRLSRS